MVGSVVGVDAAAVAILGREPLPLRWDTGWLRGKVVMVTGSAGSVGTRIVELLADAQPSRLVLVDHDDAALFEQWRHLDAASAVICLGSVADPRLMGHLLAAERPDVVIHLAAKKIVPVVEVSPYEAFRVNVASTVRLAELAANHGCQCFVHASSFDAFEPNGVFGATKLVAEHLLHELAANAQRMRCVNVRFPAVLWSRGSVSARFLELARRGAPLVVSSVDATRQFCSLGEAATALLAAATDPEPGGTVSVPVGEPLRIADLAARTIALASSDSTLVVDGVEHRSGDKVQVSHGERLGLFGARPSGLLRVPELSSAPAVLEAGHAACRAVQQVDPDQLARCVRDIVTAGGWTQPGL